MVGGLPSDGIQVMATGSDDQVVHELRSGGALEVPVSAEGRGHIAIHSPVMACFPHRLPEHQHLSSHRYLVGSPGGQFIVTIKWAAR